MIILAENIVRLMDRGILPILLDFIEHHLKSEELGYAHNVLAKLCTIRTSYSYCRRY